jgi:hypothetical protein
VNLRFGQPERRRWKRHWFNGSIRLLTESVHVDALGIKISHGGLYLFAITDLAVGAPVAVEFRPPDSREVVRLSGTVRHRAVYLYGIEFENGLAGEASPELQSQIGN